MIVSPVKQTKIEGEVNICRYLMRLLGEYPADPVAATVLDGWLDTATDIANGTNSQRSTALSRLAKQLSKAAHITGSALGIADVVNCAAFLRSVTSEKWTNDVNFKRWLESVLNRFKL